MKRVLLLDDDVDLCEILTEMILDLGALACESVNSIRALTELEGINQKFDIIFIDMNLGMGSPPGLKALEWLREQGYNGEIAFFSGHSADHPLIKEALKYGNIAFLEKPAMAHQIASLID
jgi:DNA-binding NtrC family response regulator